ncbi:hypothetical protein [uncultured Hyphomicrobium sp.]|uniref:hypothetical protein n=1 Tax=uncultured Hyphomicrobium sp. TaxID=194373 RepID=UPI0025CBAF05|nr:hypothetical protein [uncultured Hyphomicrobium sp.]
MRILIALLIATLALTPSLAKDKAKRQAAPEFSKSEHVLKWINEYRQVPDPDRLPDAVRAMGNLGLFRELDNAGVYIGFMAGVLGSNPDQAERLVSRMFPMPPEDQVVLIRAIAYSGLPDWKDLLQKFVERMPARMVLLRKYLYGDGKTLAELPIDEGGAYVIDALWGYYFATGHREPITRIVGALAMSNDKNDVEKVTIGSMAKWTLATNASREKDLLDILSGEMNTQPAEVRRPLREVIEAAETFETGKIKKDALAAIEELKTKGSQRSRDYVWWGQAGQTALALGCVGAAAGGLVALGIPCVVGGAVSGAALKYFAPEQ